MFWDERDEQPASGEGQIRCSWTSDPWKCHPWAALNVKFIGHLAGRLASKPFKGFKFFFSRTESGLNRLAMLNTKHAFCLWEIQCIGINKKGPGLQIWARPWAPCALLCLAANFENTKFASPVSSFSAFNSSSDGLVKMPRKKPVELHKYFYFYFYEGPDSRKRKNKK